MLRIDLYATHRLDPSAPPAVLLQQLDAEAAGNPDKLQRNRIATARAIIADPQRRAAYDRYLADPSAAISEETLAAISGRPVPTAGPFAGQRGVLALGIVAASMVLALVVAIAIVATSGGDDDKPTNAASSTGASQQAGDTNSRYTEDDLKRATWGENRSSAPHLAVHLTSAYDFPPGFAPLVNGNATCIGNLSCDLRQYQDKTIGLITLDATAPADQRTRVAVFGQDGRVLSVTGYHAYDDVPPKFDRMGDPWRGYFQVTAAEGIAIPAAATGTDPNMAFALNLLPDAFDDKVFWVLLRGGSQLFKADLRAA